MAITHSDVILTIGARFDDRATGKVDTFAPGAKIIHVDIDPTSISKNIRWTSRSWVTPGTCSRRCSGG